MTVEFTLSIDRSSLSLSPLILSGVDDDNTWGVLAGWQMPSREANIVYAASPFTHGATPTHWTWQTALMSGEVAPRVASAAALAAAIAELEVAVYRTSYPVEVTRGGVDWGTWEATVGTLVPSPLDYVDLADNRQVFSLTIPCHPVPS